MALFRRNASPAEVKLRQPKDIGFNANSYFAEHLSLGDVLTNRAYLLAQAAQQAIKAGDGPAEDRQSVAETLEGLYAIAGKLQEIDDTLIAASANRLSPLVRSFAGQGISSKSYQEVEQDLTEASTLRDYADVQAATIKQWIATVDRPAKRTWFEGLFQVREEVRQSLLATYEHVQELREDMSFLHAAGGAQHLLPEFAVEDARAELLTAEGEARKARELADQVAVLDTPSLAALDLPPAPPTAAEAAERGRHEV